VIFFSYPLAFDAPLGRSPSEYCHNVWCGKARWWRYLTVKNEDMFSGVDKISACDRQTDRRTDRHQHIVLAMHTRRVVKIGRPMQKDLRLFA